LKHRGNPAITGRSAGFPTQPTGWSSRWIWSRSVS